jgi:hypothetical protein
MRVAYRWFELPLVDVGIRSPLVAASASEIVGDRSQQMCPSAKDSPGERRSDDNP